MPLGFFSGGFLLVLKPILKRYFISFANIDGDLFYKNLIAINRSDFLKIYNIRFMNSLKIFR